MRRYRCPLCNEPGHSSMTCPSADCRPLGDGLHWVTNGRVERCGRIFCITCGPPTEREPAPDAGTQRVSHFGSFVDGRDG